MLKKLSLLLIAFAAIGLIPVRPALAEEPDEIVFEDYTLDLVDYTLPNGLRVILAEDRSAPVVAVDVWYRAGGADDPPNRSGFAHMFEHMMFEGSANVGNDEYHALLDN
jgi:predicted Zn-dependent peptidase